MSDSGRGRPKRRRGRGEGSIFQRKDGRYAAVVSAGYKNGKRLRRTLYGATQAEVLKQLVKVRRDQQLGLPVVLDRQTVGQFMAEWLENTAKNKVRPKTLRSYRQITNNHIVPALGHIVLFDLTPQHVQNLMGDMIKRELSARTAQYTRAVLRAALNMAMRWNLVVRNAAALADGPRALRPEIHPFSVDDLSALIKAFDAARNGTLYTLALFTGVRQGEALALRWTDIDTKEKTLTVRHTLQWIERQPVLAEPKTRLSRRTVPLTDSVVESLEKHRKAQLEDRLAAGADWQHSDFVFTTRTGRPLDGINVTRDFKRLLKNAKLPIRRFHDLRHTTASALMSLRVPVRVVQELLGHSDSRLTLDTYSHVAPIMRREAADAMEALVRPAKASA